MIRTSSRKKSVKQLTRKSYCGLETHGWSKSVITRMATNIKGETRTLSSDDNDSEAVKNFSWETIMLELKKHTPTLMSLLSLVINKPSDRIPLMYFAHLRVPTSAIVFGAMSCIIWEWMREAGN